MAARSHRFLLVLGLAAFVTLGMPDGALGTVWPFMRSDLARPLSDLGVVVSAGTIAFVAGASTVSRVVRRLGLGPTIAIAISLRLAGFIALATAAEWPIVVISSVALGFGGGWQDSALNIDFALHYGVRAMNLLHAMFGVGATIGPLLVVAVVPEWRMAYWALAALQAVVLAAVLPAANSWRTPPPRDRATAGGSVNWAIVSVFFLYTGVEVAGGGWAFSLLFEGRGMPEGTAGRWVALYWGGLTVGRLLLGAIGDRIGLRRLVDISLVVAMVGLAILWGDPAGYGSLGLPIAGLGMASLFPGFVTMTPAMVGPGQTDAAVGYQLAAAGMGAATLPWILGEVAQAWTLELIPPILLAVTLLLTGVWSATGRRHAPSRSERSGRQPARPR